jgi:hypothetical protein
MSDQSKEPFKHFFPSVSFIASILVGISTSAAISLPNYRTFFGSDDPKVLAQVQRSASFFSWGACINGGSLVLSLVMQLLYTSPHFHALATSDNHKRTVRWIAGSIGWIAILLGAGGMALVAEGLKVVERQAGLTLQWMLLGFCFPVLFFWIVFRGEHGRTASIKDNLFNLLTAVGVPSVEDLEGQGSNEHGVTV